MVTPIGEENVHNLSPQRVYGARTLHSLSPPNLHENKRKSSTAPGTSVRAVRTSSVARNASKPWETPLGSLGTWTWNAHLIFRYHSHLPRLGQAPPRIRRRARPAAVAVLCSLHSVGDVAHGELGILRGAEYVCGFRVYIEYCIYSIH